MKALTGNLGLKIVALVLAIALYYALKPDTPRSGEKHDNRQLQQP